MKKLILLALMSALAMSGLSAETNMKNFTTIDADKRLCKIYIKKAHNYQATMGESNYSESTLESYKEKVVSHCSTVALGTKNKDNKVLCKTSIKDAQEYKATMNGSKEDKEAYDAHIAKVRAHCGTLVAKS